MLRQANTTGLAARLRFGWSSWPGDLVAGVTVAAIAVPEQMATARLGHFPPQAGLLAFVAASVGFFLFGAGRSVSVGADSTITPIFAGALLLATAGASSFQDASILALMVGAIVALAGYCRMGWVSSLLSAPVTCGFLAGIALHIVSSQLPVFCGLPSVAGDVASRFVYVVQNLPRANLYAVMLGSAVLVVTVAVEATDRRYPGALVGVASATVCTAALGLQRHGVQVLGAVPPMLPHFALYVPTAAHLGSLSLLAFLLAFVVMVQTAATSRSSSSDEDTVAIDRNFVGVGAANVLAGLAGTFPVNASPPRSVIAAEAGARSRMAGLVAALAVALLATAGARLLGFVPNAALAAILLFVAWRIVQFGLASRVWRDSKPEFALIVATALAIVVLPIQTGVAAGIILSLLHGIWTTTRAKVIELKRVHGTTIWWPASPGEAEENSEVLVAAFQAPLSFLNADTFRDGIMRRLANAPASLRLLVLEASSIVEIDFTAAHALRDVIAFCRDRGVRFAVARLESLRAQDSFKRLGITEMVGNEHFYHSVYEAVEALAPNEALTE